MQPDANLKKMFKVSKKEVLEILALGENLETSISRVLTKINKKRNELSDNDLKRLKTALSTLKCKNYKRRKNVSWHGERNDEWLDSEFVMHFDSSSENINEEQSFSKPGRPRIAFEEKSKRSVRREVAGISADLNHDPKKILLACQYASRRSGYVDLLSVLGDILQSPDFPIKLP